jgi:hypothetical protein
VFPIRPWWFGGGYGLVFFFLIRYPVEPHNIPAIQSTVTGEVKRITYKSSVNLGLPSEGNLGGLSMFCLHLKQQEVLLYRTAATSSETQQTHGAGYPVTWEKKNQKKLLKRGQQVDQASSEEHKEKKAKQHSSPRGAAHKRPTYSQISTTLPKNAAPGSCACHPSVCAVHPERSQTVPESDIGLPGLCSRRSKRGTVPWVPVLDKPLLVALRTTAQLSSGSQGCGSGE